MIVKNEESVIRRALMSVIDNIDVFRIVDTGSTDRTIEIIEEVLAGRDYKVIQSDFKGFGPSRTEAYNLIKDECDWVLTMDADMELVGDIMVPEYGDAVWAVQVVQGAESKNYRLLGTHINWECIGMCHEYWKSDVYIEPTEQDFKLICHQDGGSNYINKNKMYLDLLRQDPDGARKFFYIAQTLFVMRKFVEAIGYYEKCINASVWDEEIWFCHFQIAKCMDYAGYSDSDVLAKLKVASFYRHRRIEPIFFMVKKLMMDEKYQAAYDFGIGFVDSKKPNDKFSVEVNVYKWELKYNMAVCAFKIGENAKALELLTEIKNSGDLPSYAMDMVEQGLRSVPSVQ